MKRIFAAGFVACLLVCVMSGNVFAKSEPGRLDHFRFFEMPAEPMNPPEIGGSMFESAAASTVVLAWYQFDSPGGAPDPQDWTAVDNTVQVTFFHVDGQDGAPCTGAIAPLGGSHSMWCGKEASAESPYCSWLALPGYGNDWDESLASTVNANALTYDIAWDSEDGYDYIFVEWWNASNQTWVVDTSVNGGAGYYTNVGAATGATSSAASAGVTGPTRVRFHFVSDVGWSDEDGMRDSMLPGAVIVDNLRLDAGPVEDWEGESCGAKASEDGAWLVQNRQPYGLYAHLVHSSTIVQEDPCRRVSSNLWAFFDDPAVTNYACGGWPLQGAVPYTHGTDLCIDNAIISPWIPIVGAGSEYVLSFLTYRDLSLDDHVFFDWSIRTRNNDPPANGCPTLWSDDWYYGYGKFKDWATMKYEIGGFVPGSADEIQIALRAYDDFCSDGWPLETCHSHAPLFDQVRIVRVDTDGPQWTIRHIDLWQDNFPELGGIGPTDYARCDMAQDILAGGSKNIVPGDSLKVTVTDQSGVGDSGFAVDATGGRSRPSVYVFVRCTDRFGNPRPYTGAQMESPDDKSWSGDPQAGLKRFPLVTGITVTPPSEWEVYRMDGAYTSNGSGVIDAFCADLMDLHAGPHAYAHVYEPAAANTGIFAPGDVIHYFLGAKNSLGNWSYYHRTYNGQGGARRTTVIAEAVASPMEWSVLPDAGRLPGYLGDILFVDDADDRGGPAQLYFDFAFQYMGIEERVDRFDVLGPSSGVGNSLAGRVKDIQTQLIGSGTEIYQKILWNCSDLSTSLMGDGGAPNGGGSVDKSQDFGLCDFFLDNHPDNPGWAYWGDDVVAEWNLLGPSPTPSAVRTNWMNHTFASDDQKISTGMISPHVLISTAPAPALPYFVPTESFYAHGGCPAINNFDVSVQSANSRIAYRYHDAATGPVASLSQVTPNSQGTNARFYLSGFAFNFIRDDDTNGVPDYVKHLQEVLAWFGNLLEDPVGIDPVAYADRLENAYPNPFNPATTITYSIASAGRVSLKVYNAAGQLVRTLVDEDQSPRPEGFTVTWDGLGDRGGRAASGVYFCKLTAREFSQTKKMVLLK
jgi:hypothetical protein